MRRLRRSAERAAAATSSSTSSYHGPSSGRFNASRRIPSWNIIARENSTGSLEEDILNEVASSMQRGARYRGTHHRGNNPEGSDSESESTELSSWTRSGGPLMRTASATKFIDFVQSLECEFEVSKIPSPRSSRLVVGEGDLLQAERIQDGFLLNVVKKEDLASPCRSHDYNSGCEAAECVQLDCQEKEMGSSWGSEDDEVDGEAELEDESNANTAVVER